MSEQEVALIFNFKGTLLSEIVLYEQYQMSYSISVVFTPTESIQLIRLKCFWLRFEQQQTLSLLLNFEFWRNDNDNQLHSGVQTADHMYSVQCCSAWPKPFSPNMHQSQICILIVKYQEWSRQRCVLNTYIKTRNWISIDNHTTVLDECSLQRSDIIISKFAQHKGGSCLQLQSLEECKGSGMVSGKKVTNKKEERKTVEVKY